MTQGSHQLPYLLERLGVRCQLWLIPYEAGRPWGLWTRPAALLGFLGHPMVRGLSIFATWPTTTCNCEESCWQTPGPEIPGDAGLSRPCPWALASSTRSKGPTVLTGQEAFTSPKAPGGDRDGHSSPYAFQTPPESVFQARLSASQILTLTSQILTSMRVTWGSRGKHEF